MRRIVFISIFISILLSTGCNTRQIEQKEQDAFASLKWHDEFCDNVVGLYRYWYPAPIWSPHVDNEMTILDRPILKKNTTKIYFRNQLNHYGNKPELDFGEFSYKIYKQADNHVAIELEDKFLEVLKEKLPKGHHYFGKYFVFNPIYRDLKEKGSKSEDWNCMLSIASCKTTKQVEKFIADKHWYFGHREDGDCERELFLTTFYK